MGWVLNAFKNVTHVARCLRAVAALRATFSALFLTVSISAQISPGPLAHAHKDIDSPANCTRCHAVKAGSPNFRCLDCHREIAIRLRQHRGYHAAVVESGASTNSCIKCHSDHNGENFSLIHWDPKTFDHSKTGYPLQGKHANITCAKCHNDAKVFNPERVSIQMHDLNRTYLGLSRTCSSCHEDKHRGQLGDNCARCHNENTWKFGKDFDHSKTKYALTGTHANVACQKCHMPAADGTVRYVGLKFDRCADCHSDVHHGSFKEACEICHKTIGWRRSPTLIKFDHSTTKYPLEGKHVEVACGKCHHSADFKRALVFKACADCHNPDPHSGQFAKRKDAGACEACHTLNGFKPARFTASEHMNVPFPLRGKHVEVKCEKCHTPAGKATQYMVKFDLCLDCHKDIHKNQFAGPPHMNRCEDCHDEHTFHRTPMTLAKHQQLSFKLTGGHIAVACIDCHKVTSENGPALYRFVELSCTTCHVDTHRGEFADRMKRTSNATHPAGCTVCHSTDTWKNLSGFDHSETQYKLDGTHKGVACAECHRPPNMERDLRNVNFKAAPSKCEQCHEDVHGVQFMLAGERATNCGRCHNSTKWRPSTFDHERTQFSLKGPHQNARCKACHINVSNIEGKPVLFYKPTPKACASCHAGDIRLVSQSPESTHTKDTGVN